MKKATKICLCVLTIALVLCSCVSPCFAMDWANELGQTSTLILTSPSQALVDGWGSQEATRLLTAIVDNAYNENAFNGRKPVAIIFYGTSANVVYIQVVTCNESYPVENFEEANARLEYYSDTSMVLRMEQISGATNTQLQMFNYFLTENGSFKVGGTQGATSMTISSTSGRYLYAYYANGNWVTDPTSEYYITSFGLPGNQIPIDGVLTEPGQNAPSQLTEIASKWEPTNPVIERPQYVLDIPGIITAVPNGAKQIINNAFGFEIFGINVAGLLSVVLIVTIVAFVVKWLMSR